LTRRTRWRTATLTLAILFGIYYSCLAASAAFAWSNGPQYGQGFGTHDWVLYQANRLAAEQGYAWVDEPLAVATTDDPDTVLHDSYYHVYDIWGDTYGNSPQRVADLYRQAVGELKAGDRAAASRTVGMLSHYYADTANPLHTDQTPAETRMHSRYEDAVDNQTREPESLPGVIGPHTVSPVSDPTAFTADAARSAHGSYEQLVSEYNRSGNDAAAQAITAESLNRAVDGVADIIAGITVAAGVEPSAAAPTTTPVRVLPPSGSAASQAVAWFCLGIAIGAALLLAFGLMVWRQRRS
jgi:hypothetical protein